MSFYNKAIPSHRRVREYQIKVSASEAVYYRRLWTELNKEDKRSIREYINSSDFSPLFTYPGIGLDVLINNDVPAEDRVEEQSEQTE